MKKAYIEPEFEVRNYTLIQNDIMTTSVGGDLNGGDDTQAPYIL